MNKRIEYIIVKYFDNEISEAEANELIVWIENGNRAIFNEYIMLNFSIEQLKFANDNKENSSWAKIEALINHKESTKVIPMYRRKLFRYVAVIIVLIASGYFLTQIIKPTTNNSVQKGAKNNSVQIGTEKATLTLEDGSSVTLKKGKGYNTKTVQSNGEKLVYTDQKEKKVEEVVYNILTIPRGGQFFVELADDTKVWLNSESQLKYPVAFIEGKTRKVELLYGEAYFEVSPSTMHEGAKFKVINQAQEIEVLGTKFNIKAYKEESNIYTTLIEGKVKVKTAAAKQLLKPNQQSKVQIENNQLSVQEVDVSGEIAWVHGDFIFKHKKLKDIVTVLGRWYNVDFEIQNKSLENVKFNGDFGRSQNLEDILILIKNTNYINQYEINEKKIILK